MRVRTLFPVLAALTIATVDAPAQSVLADVLAGKLVKPKAGQWSWYDLTDARSNRRFALRQAIVGEEKIGKDTAYWLETEVVPDLGFPMFYKMLLTGPASDPKNIHKILFKYGRDPVSELPAESLVATPASHPEPKRTNLGKADLETPKGVISTNHVVVSTPEGAVELWLNDEVRPMGIVRLRNANGDLLLRDYGVGGPMGASRMESAPIDVEAPSLNTTVEVEILPPEETPETPKSDPEKRKSPR